jgi:hypothetical protein
MSITLARPDIDTLSEKMRNIKLEECKTKRYTLFIPSLNKKGEFVIKKKWTDFSKFEKMNLIINFTKKSNELVPLNSKNISSHRYKNIKFDFNTQSIISMDII